MPRGTQAAEQGGNVRLRRFLAGLATDRSKLGAYMADPDASMRAAGLSAEQRRLLESGNLAEINASIFSHRPGATAAEDAQSKSPKPPQEPTPTPPKPPGKKPGPKPGKKPAKKPAKKPELPDAPPTGPLWGPGHHPGPPDTLPTGPLSVPPGPPDVLPTGPLWSPGHHPGPPHHDH